MRLLEDDENNEQEVSQADQEQINRFSKLNGRLDDILEEVAAKKESKEALDDLSTELELEDEDELIPYQLQSAFLHLPIKQVLDLTQNKCEQLDAELDALDTEADECRKGMQELKVQLYAKFGRSINLERGDDQ